MPIDYEAALKLLDDAFERAEASLLNRPVDIISANLREAFDLIFASSTQAYREGLVGCVIARIQDKNINIRLPYIKQGPTAYNGRTLDERVVNPFLHSHRVPCSRAPFLSTFRRGIQFDEGTTRGVRDVEGYRAFLSLVGHLERTQDNESLLEFLHYLMLRFARLREDADIPLSRLQRISLDQFDTLISSLLGIPSGGRIPVMLVVAILRAVQERFGLEWVIEYQGINVADAQTGMGGDITVSSGGRVVFAAEITERPLERSRVVSTFNMKIAPNGIEDYLFFIRLETLSADARQQAKQYFAQGHELNFLEIRQWILMTLATIGKEGRAIFNVKLLEIMGDASTPRSLKVAWNNSIDALTTPS